MDKLSKTVEIGQTGEALAMAALARSGVQVFVPVGDGSPVDIIADFGGHPPRIQVKTTAAEGELLRYDIDARHRSGSYDDVALDWYACVSLAHGTVTLVPANIRAGVAYVRYSGGPRNGHKGRAYSSITDSAEAVVDRYRAGVTAAHETLTLTE